MTGSARNHLWHLLTSAAVDIYDDDNALLPLFGSTR